MARDPVLTALLQQVQCYQRLAKLALAQHEHVRTGRTEDLLSVLAQRQEVLDQVIDLEQSIAPAKKGWGAYVAGLSGDDRRAAESGLEETRRLLGEITESDQHDSIVLQQRKFNLGRDINNAVAARKFNARYAAAAYGPRRSILDTQQ
jgi:hypothetical protein